MKGGVPHENEEVTGWDAETTLKTLDELFTLARRFRSGREYAELMVFLSRFRTYSFFNAMLIHVQMPGATYVAPPSRWWRKYRRRIQLGARPLVILKPMGPVMFVYDVSDTVPNWDAPNLPIEVTAPFAVRTGEIRSELDRTIDNAIRDGVFVDYEQAGSQMAGSIRSIASGAQRLYPPGSPKGTGVYVPILFGILLNRRHSREEQYASLVHELAHLYCGHLGSPDESWWPDRANVAADIAELEAESVCYLVCGRMGIDNPSEKYMSNYINGDREVADISLDAVIRASALIEQMGQQSLPLRKPGKRKK